jgi:hypothetical protein
MCQCLPGDLRRRGAARIDHQAAIRRGVFVNRSLIGHMERVVRSQSSNPTSRRWCQRSLYIKWVGCTKFSAHMCGNDPGIPPLDDLLECACRHRHAVHSARPVRGTSDRRKLVCRGGASLRTLPPTAAHFRSPAPRSNAPESREDRRNEVVSRQDGARCLTTEHAESGNKRQRGDFGAFERQRRGMVRALYVCVANLYWP